MALKRRKMKYFSVPADFKKETIDAYERLNNTYNDSKLVETYGNITMGNFFGSGRLAKQMRKIDTYDLHEYVDYCKERNIDFNYTFNFTHMRNREFTREGINEIAGFIKKIYQANVRIMTVTLPSIIELIRATGLDIKIKASTICQVVNANKALFYKKLGVERIVVDESINRNFAALRAIRDAFGQNVEVIVNQVCDLNCVYRIFHYNMISEEREGTVHDVGIDFYEHRCVMQQFKTPDNLIKLSWIRPEDLKYYTAIGINYFKLQGRHTFVKGGDPVRTLEYYFKESFDGNLMDLLSMFATMNNFKVYVDNKSLDGFLKPFFEGKKSCANHCTQCKYCCSYAQKAINLEKAVVMMRNAEEFYDEYDTYKKMIHSVDWEKEDGPGEIEADFDI
jgi:collagenase-like PrtC family protease